MKTQSIFALVALCCVFLLSPGLVSAGSPPPANVNVVNTPTVKNMDAPGRTPYQHMIEFSTYQSDECPLPSYCAIPFPAVPAGKRLVVEHVTMLIAVHDGQPGLLAFGDTNVTNSGNQAIISNAFTNTGVNASPDIPFFSLDRPVRVYYEAGATPRLKLVTTGGTITFKGNASIHGYLIDAD